MAKTIICKHCGRRFTANAYNKHHQAYCTNPECQKARKREDMRRYHEKKLGVMTESGRATFRRQERLRVNAIRQRSRAAGEDRVSPKLPPRPPPDMVQLGLEMEFLSRVLVGLTVQLSGVSGSDEAWPVIRRYAEMGRSPSSPG